QNPYSIGAKPSGHAFLRECGQQGVAFVPFFAIAGQSREAGASDEQVAELDVIAKAHGATPAQVSLAWTLAQGRHVLAIPGTSNPGHLDENVAAAAITLSEDERACLEGVSPTVAETAW